MTAKTDKTETFDLDALEEQMRAGREALTARHGELKEELDKVAEQLRKIESYFNPVAISPQPQPSAPRATGAKRGPRKGKSEQVITLLAKHPDGLASGEIIKALPDLKSIPNLLSNMLKEDQPKIIKEDKKGGKYKLANPKSNIND